MSLSARPALMLGFCLALMTNGASPASAAWHQASSRHFVIYSDDQPERLRAYAE